MRNIIVSKTKTLKLLVLMVCALNAAAVSGQENLVLETDFEKGTQKWEARGTGNVSIGTTKKEALTGDRSLGIRGRKESWQGAQLNVTRILKPGVTYLFTASVKLRSGEKPDDIKMTMQRGDKQFDGVAMARVTDSEWTTLSGRFRPVGVDPFLLVYIEAAGERTSYYIDDFKIELLEAPEQAGTLVKSDFQDGTAQNWLVRGENVQIFSAAVGDQVSLKIGGRTEPWHGLAFDLSEHLFKGRTYKMSVSVKLTQGQSADSLKMSVIETAPDGESGYVDVAMPKEVTDSDWVTLEGDYIATKEGYNLVVIVEAKGPGTEYYIDDFELKIP